MKRYIIINRHRLYEGILGIILIGVILFSNYHKNEEYKNKQNIYILTSEQQEFIDNWNGIPNELREWMDEYEEEEFRTLDIPLSIELQKYTWDMCKKYDVDYMFVISVMATESSFKVDTKCKNQTNQYYSRGLLQLNEKYIDEFKQFTGIKNFNIRNPKHNIEGGIAKLSQLQKYWSQYELSDDDIWLAVLNSYNKGLNLYKREVVSRGGFFSREYDRKVYKNKEKLEGGN